MLFTLRKASDATIFGTHNRRMIHTVENLMKYPGDGTKMAKAHKRFDGTMAIRI